MPIKGNALKTSFQHFELKFSAVDLPCNSEILEALETPPPWQMTIYISFTSDSVGNIKMGWWCERNPRCTTETRKYIWMCVLKSPALWCTNIAGSQQSLPPKRSIGHTLWHKSSQLKAFGNGKKYFLSEYIDLPSPASL